MAKRYDQACPVAKALEVVGDRWTLLMVRDLLRGAQRFQDFLASLPGIAPTILSDRLKLMEEHDRTRLTSSIWARALERKDKLAVKLIGEAVRALGAGVGSSVNLLDVEAVIIGGGLGTRFGQPMATRIAKAMQPHLFNDTNPPDVLVASLGDQGGAMGAALLIKRARRPNPS